MCRTRSVAFLLALALIVTGITIAALAQSRPYEGTTIRYVAANHPWTEALTPLIPEFERQTGIRVRVESYFEDQLSQKLTVEFTSGRSTIDVFMMRPPQEGKLFVQNGWMADLGSLVEDPSLTPASWDFDDFYASSIAAVTEQGMLYAIPVVVEQEILYYRKDLFEKASLQPPKTFEELEAAAARLHDPSAGIYGFVSRGQRAAAVTQFSGYLYSFGGDWMDANGNSAIATPEAIRAFEFYGKMLRQYGPPGALNMHWPQAVALFSQGQAAMYTDASSLFPNMTDPTRSVVADKVGFAPFPAGPAGSKPYTVVPWAIAIYRGSANKEAAWEFVKWATSKEIVTRTQAKANPGARASVWQTAEGRVAFPAEWIEAAEWANQVGVPYDRPLVIHVGEARDIIGSLITAAIEGRNVAALAPEASRQFQQLIEQER